VTVTLHDALTSVSARMPDPWATGQVDLYERELAQHFGTAEAIAVASGTAALHCALIALGVGKDDEVLVSAAASPSSVAPILYLGAAPVFVDSGIGGISLDLHDVASKITERTRVIIAVHLWGRTGDLVRLVEFAGAHGLKVVEDARDAVGTRFDDQYAGDGCLRARNYVDSSLAIILTQRDTDDRIRQIASVIDTEAQTWAPV
jgi:perosamine synthetase